MRLRAHAYPGTRWSTVALHPSANHTQRLAARACLSCRSQTPVFGAHTDGSESDHSGVTGRGARIVRCCWRGKQAWRFVGGSWLQKVSDIHPLLRTGAQSRPYLCLPAGKTMFGKLLLLSILVSRLLFSYIRKSRSPRSSATDVGITMLEASARAGLNSAILGCCRCQYISEDHYCLCLPIHYQPVTYPLLIRPSISATDRHSLQTPPRCTPPLINFILSYIYSFFIKHVLRVQPKLIK